MILPTKHISEQNTLLFLGKRVLESFSSPITFTSLWAKVNPYDRLSTELTEHKLRYQEFILTLDLLYLMDLIKLNHGQIIKVKK